MEVGLTTILLATLVGLVTQAAGSAKRCYVCRSRGPRGDCEYNELLCHRFSHLFSNSHEQQVRILSGGMPQQSPRLTQSNCLLVHPAGVGKQLKAKTAIICKQLSGCAYRELLPIRSKDVPTPFTRTKGHQSSCAFAKETCATKHKSILVPYRCCRFRYYSRF